MDFTRFVVFRSLLFPPLIAGMPRSFALMVGIVTMVMVFSLGQIWFLIFPMVPVVLIATQATKYDPYIFDICKEVLSYPKVAE